MNVYHARTQQEKADGVSVFERDQFTRSAMIFHDIGPGSHFHMSTVDYPIGILSLDEGGKILDKSIMAARSQRRWTSSM